MTSYLTFYLCFDESDILSNTHLTSQDRVTKLVQQQEALEPGAALTSIYHLRDTLLLLNLVAVSLWTEP